MRILCLSVVLVGAASFAHAEPRDITANIWADNWFELFVNGEKVAEDSVPITTERSFNQETVTFSADLPMAIAIKAMDFKENDSGLEYIGSRRQQMGDGGLIAQFMDAGSGALIAVTSANMRCLVVHRAPLDRACEQSEDPVAGEGSCAFLEADVPSNWSDPGFDDSDWAAAVEHSESDVSPKQGYDEINWDETAQLIWSEDLELDNTVLCRLTVLN